MSWDEAVSLAEKINKHDWAFTNPGGVERSRSAKTRLELPKNVQIYVMKHQNVRRNIRKTRDHKPLYLC